MRKSLKSSKCLGLNAVCKLADDAYIVWRSEKSRLELAQIFRSTSTVLQSRQNLPQVYRIRAERRAVPCLIEAGEQTPIFLRHLGEVEVVAEEHFHAVLADGKLLAHLGRDTERFGRALSGGSSVRAVRCGSTHLVLQLRGPGVQQLRLLQAVGQLRSPRRRPVQLGLPRGVRRGQRGGGGPRHQQQQQQRRRQQRGADTATVPGKLHRAPAARLRPRPLLVGEAGGLSELRASLNVYLLRGLRDYSWPGKIRHENTGGVCSRIAPGLTGLLESRDCETGWRGWLGGNMK